MGRKARAKQERRTATPERPRWAGAPGFDKSFRLAEQYQSIHEDIRFAAEVTTDERDDLLALVDSGELSLPEARDLANAQVSAAEARIRVLRFQGDLLDRQYATIASVARQRGISEPTGPVEPMSDHQIRGTADFLPYAEGLAKLADAHLVQLRQATPVVFDPLGVPEPSTDALDGFGLPFPCAVADFFSTTGMSLPVQGVSDDDGWWVGLVAATITQSDPGGTVDVWPTVTTLHADRPNDRQAPRELMFGTVRFGAPLGPAPDGLRHVKLNDCEAWVVDIDHPEPWAELWLRAPALAAISALRLLDAVNVDLIEKPMARAERRRADREGAKPALMVDVRTNSMSSSDPTGTVGTVDWSHRWTVRGHWRHHGEGTAIARRHPSRLVDVPGRGRCVKVWCPPYVKGPADKPLVLKTRVKAAA
jgi:hypothetical protein